MGRSLYIFATLALFVAACTNSREIRYAEEYEQAREGDYIKDPEAVGTTRDETNRSDTTRTESNRVDIPVIEFAQVMSFSSGAAAHRNSGYDARYTRSTYNAMRYLEYTERGWTVARYGDSATSEALVASRNATTYPALRGNEELNWRLSRDRTSAYSALETPWASRTMRSTEAYHSDSRTSAMRSEAYLESVRGRAGYESAFGSRVIGLHLWKYADREIVTDAVEITYTIVYYNTNEYNTGPTEIDEPVPFYTEYIKDSATLPKEGTSVQFIDRKDRDILRWKFPKGIEPGETNKMTYKVIVRLDPEKDEYLPPEERPSMPDRDN